MDKKALVEYIFELAAAAVVIVAVITMRYYAVYSGSKFLRCFDVVIYVFTKIYARVCIRSRFTVVV